MVSLNRVPPSRYNSPLRARQAAETRRSVIVAAERLFAERGWAGTTLMAIARDAGTAVETIYLSFGSKAGLLLAAIDAAIVGDDGPTSVTERPEFAGLGIGPREARLKVGARIVTRALRQAVPLMGALREAAASDETASARLDRYESERRITTAAGLELILGDKPSPELVDSMWALTSPEVFVKLTRQRSWDLDRYEAWLVQIAAAALWDVGS